MNHVRRVPTYRILAAIALLLGAPSLPAQSFFSRADTDASGTVNLGDGVAVLRYLFSGGDEPPCLDAADSDDSGVLNLNDGVFILRFLFQGGAVPPEPGPSSCGGDPTADDLGCVSFAPCRQSSGDPVEDSLAALNIDTSQTPRVERVGDREEPLPDDYAPLGSTLVLNRPDEIFLLGFDDRLATDIPGASTRRTSILKLGPPPSHAPAVLQAAPRDATPWASQTGSSRSVPQRLRDATAGDIDGDGLEEVVVAYLAGGELRFATFGDEDDGFAQRDHAGTAAAGFTDVSAAAGDFDGDGVSEVAVALASVDAVEIVFAGWSGDGFVVDGASTISIAPRGAREAIFTSLAVGNVDRDGAEELVLVVNEQFRIFNGNDGLAHYHVYDDAIRERAELKAGTLTFMLGGRERHGVVGDASLGDIDGDNVDELLIGGLAQFNDSGCATVPHLLYAFDDARTDFAPLGERRIDHFFRGCPSFSPWSLRYVHVNTGDLDGDGVDEVQVNQFIFEDWRAGAWTELVNPASDPPAPARIDEERFFRVNDFGWMDRSTLAMTVAPVTGDGRAKVIFYAQNRNEVYIWGLEQIGGWKELRGSGGGALIPAGFANAQTPIHPVIVPVNVTKDEGMVLRYEGGEHRLIFTEPVVHAVLAAPPCHDGGGQVTDACRTSYGLSDSQTVSREERFTISTSVHVGASVEFSVLGVELGSLEVKQTVSASVSESQLSAYTLEETVEFTSGPLEDTVIFSTIPYDQYVYTVVSHPDPGMIGETVVVSLPRTPITLAVERGFYNANVAVGAFQVDEQVLGHVPGDPASYPRRGDKNTLLQRWNGLESSVQTVGQGGGERSVTLSFREEFGRGYEFTIGSEFELETTTLGLMSGFRVGVEAGSSVQYAKGVGTQYRGTVGSLADLENGYSYGLFTYVQRDEASGQEFEVINYWVE